MHLCSPAQTAPRFLPARAARMQIPVPNHLSVEKMGVSPSSATHPPALDILKSTTEQVHIAVLIKRRSAFTYHLQLKHDINPNDIDIDALGPPARSAPYQRGRFRKNVEDRVENVISPLNYVCHDSTSYYRDEAMLQPIASFFNDPFAIDDGTRNQGAIDIPAPSNASVFPMDMTSHLPVLSTEGLSTFSTPAPLPSGGLMSMDSAISIPRLSISPSPPHLLYASHDMGYASSSSSYSSPSTPSPETQLIHSSPLFKSIIGESQKPITHWNLDAPIFGATHNLLYDIHALV
ncbi:hypothetical protein H0H92_001264 [Tricholoma furcatifolium]|nr:hypothetical protein H0H92_001264 [Tricholoma furcatifolium]